MKRIFLWIILGVCFLTTNTAFCQVPAGRVREEKEERRLNVVKPENKLLPLGLSAKFSVSSGYDSNVNLSPVKKGDIFEEFMFNLGYDKRLFGNLKLTLDYGLDFLNYNEITTASSLLNNFRFGLHEKLGFLRIGAGYDLAIVYYLNNDDDFLFQKGFAYIGHDLTKKIYHQIQCEYGVKNYNDQLALGDTINTYQPNYRTDKRYSGVYTVDFSATRKLRLGFLARFSANDSNARYQNFYDYKSYQGSPYLDYSFTNKLRGYVNFSYTRKNYNKRRLTLGTVKERDDLYVAKTGLSYAFNKNNSLALYYTYRDNASKEDLEEYTENVIGAGWQCRF